MQHECATREPATESSHAVGNGLLPRFRSRYVTMDENYSHNQKENSQTKKDDEFNRFIKCIRRWGKWKMRFWLDFSKESSAIKFWIELFTLVVIAAYMT